ncbi:MAG: protein kinase [Acidobacteriia bacterium]|nr:protein kinase [Terriglobia bacterium]
MAVPRACSVVKQVSSALDAAHRLGLIHRDIKPDNIVLIDTPEGEQAKVLDFGIAKLKESRRSDTSGMTLTGTGVVIGTPQYMSPEQAMGKRGDQLDGRSDLYSLGIVMYQMLTGDLPFHADTTMEMLLAHLQTPPTPIRSIHPELQIPEPIANLVMRLLAKKPEQRPASAEALIAEIERAETAGAGPMAEPGAVEETRLVTPRGVYSPDAAAEALRSALRANPPLRRAGSQAAVATPPPAVGARPAPTPPPAPQPRPAARPVGPVPAPVPARSSQWGIWAGVVILVVGLGGGTWYYVEHSAPRLPEAPVSGTTAAPSVPAANTPSATQPAATTPSSAGQPEPSTTRAAQPAPEHPAVTGSPSESRGSTRTARPQPLLPAREVAPERAPARPVVDPRQINAAVKVGDLLRERGDYDGAIAEYQRGLHLDPTNQVIKDRIERARRAKAAEERVNQ